MIERAWAESFAREWIGAWNSHDLEADLLALCRRLRDVELLGVYVGVDKIGIHYRNVGRRLAVEVLTLNAARQVTHGAALYGDLA